MKACTRQVFTRNTYALLLSSTVQPVCSSSTAAAAHIIGAKVEEMISAHAAAAALRCADSSCRGWRITIRPALVQLLLLRCIGCLLCWPAATRICT